MLLQEEENCFLWVVCANMSLRCNTNICRLNTVAHGGSGLTLWIRIWASFVPRPPSACKADVVLSLSVADVKPWHVATKVASPDIGGSVPYAYVSGRAGLLKHTGAPLPTYGCPLETGLVLIPGFEKHRSQPSQKQSCIKHPTDTLTNKREFKPTDARAGAAADGGLTMSVCWKLFGGKWRHARLTNQLGRVVVSCYNAADGLL